MEGDDRLAQGGGEPGVEGGVPLLVFVAETDDEPEDSLASGTGRRDKWAWRRAQLALRRAEVLEVQSVLRAMLIYAPIAIAASSKSSRREPVRQRG